MDKTHSTFSHKTDSTASFIEQVATDMYKLNIIKKNDEPEAVFFDSELDARAYQILVHKK